MGGDLVISSAALTVFTALLAAVAGALSWLFRLLLQAKDAALVAQAQQCDETCAELRQDRNYWREAALRNLHLGEQGVGVLERVVDRQGGPRER